MTLHATRDGQTITVHGNTGTEVLVQDGHVRHVRITEDAQHVRFFHRQIGALLDDIEGKNDDGKTPGQHAYEAYSKHVGGVSVKGDELPAWDGQLVGIREAWAAAAAATSGT